MPYRNNNVAGKQTFMPEDGKNSNYYQHSKYFTPKLLNHADEVGTILWLINIWYSWQMIVCIKLNHILIPCASYNYLLCFLNNINIITVLI